MKKKIILLALVTLMMAAGCGHKAKLSAGTVVSMKGSEIISIDSLYNEMKDKYAISTLVDMIDTKILNKEYPTVTEAKEDYVTSNIEGIKANYDTDAEFLQAIKYYYGANSEEEFKEYLGLNYLRNLAVDDYAKSLVKEKEITKYYKSDIVGDIRCSHILINIETGKEAEALAKAKSLIKQLKASKDVTTLFAKLAKENSDDTGSAANGGDLGWFNKGQMYTEFETAAYALKKGEFTTTPIKTTVGYHIILKTDTKAKASLKDSRASIISTLANKKITANPEIQLDALTNLRKKYDVKIEDSELSTQYNTYLQNILNNLLSSD
jgi:foldase protein PrsA